MVIDETPSINRREQESSEYTFTLDIIVGRVSKRDSDFPQLRSFHE